MKAYLRGLENFGDPSRGRESDAERATKAAIASARGEGHAAGYAEGFAAALAQAENEDRAAIGALREAIRDLELVQTGARAETVAGLRPVLEAVMRLAAPAAAEAGLAASVAAAVTARLDRGRGERLVVRAAPDRVEMLRDRLGPGGPTVEADPALGAAAVRLDWDGGGAVFDVQAALAAAREAIDAFFGEINDERLRHAG